MSSQPITAEAYGQAPRPSPAGDCIGTFDIYLEFGFYQLAPGAYHQLAYKQGVDIGCVVRP